MPSMEAYASPKKRVIDLPAWTRRDNHELFRDFLYPNLAVMVRVDGGTPIPLQRREASHPPVRFLRDLRRCQ